MAPVSYLLRSRLLLGRQGVQHAFTHRGSPPTDQVDLRDRPYDPQGAVHAWERVMAAVGGSTDQVAQVRQVHGADVALVDQPTGPLAVAAEADALVTTTPGIWLAVRTADCVPILLSAPGAVAAVHAGWRGVAAGVVPAAVQLLVERSGAQPMEVAAAIGPHASVERYETGPEVVAQLERAGLDPARVSRTGPSGRLHTDLEQAVRDQLGGLGVRSIERVAGCTLREERFYSHRRLGPGSGRQASLIALR